MVRTLGTILCAGLVFAARPGRADEAPVPAPDRVGATALDEIVVTALKRSERQQRVPVAITTLAAGQLVAVRVDTASVLAEQVPNLHVNGINGTQTPVFSLRGVSMFDFSFNQSSPVAAYKDEVYKGNPAIFGVELFDLSRIEVLRGPQGTLFGKNTTGGAIDIVSVKPGFGTEGYLRVGVGDYDRREIEGAAQTAIVRDKLAVRAAFTYAGADGWVHNIAPGQPNFESVDQWGGRVSLLYRAAPSLKMTLVLSASHQHPTEYAVYARPGPLGIGAGVYASFHASDPVHNPNTDYFRTGLSPYQIDTPRTLYRRQNTQAAALTIDWSPTRAFDVTSISSYDYGEIFVPDGTDGAPIEVIRINYFGRTHQYTQDLRITSALKSPLSYIVGVYYQHENVFNSTEQQFFNGIDVNGDGRIDSQDCIDGGLFIACRYGNHFRQIRDSVAVYTDESYALSPVFKLRAGLRYTDDTGRLRDFTAQVRGPDGTPIANTVPGDPVNLNAVLSNNLHNRALSGRAGIDVTPSSDLLIYGSYSRGYRSGAFNAQAFFSAAEATVVKPETIDAFELGAKWNLFHRALEFSGSLFTYDYRNQQILNINPATSAQQLINLQRSRVRGLEIEAAARPVSALTLRSSFSLLDATFRQAVVSGTDVSGNVLPNAPRYAATASLDWQFGRVGRSTATLHLDGSYRSRQYFEAFNVARLAQAPYALLNGRVSADVIAERLEVALWAKNLTDHFYVTSAIDIQSGFGVDYFHLGAPRTFGAEATVRF